ncbi:hypothetical protein DM01DRAFT_1403049 [Hesseltinella vesiculosa]|uniref:Uncharacterized protein n=1 Tax=Hesseltinella vesiculosa TaxID=101127 RepID=A0A1X2GY57_9FUNG|nr:hypothetical protein DM01DRAFT_1403049 [Hesseltinella vesiculosa]
MADLEQPTTKRTKSKKKHAYLPAQTASSFGQLSYTPMDFPVDHVDDYLGTYMNQLTLDDDTMYPLYLGSEPTTPRPHSSLPWSTSNYYDTDPYALYPADPRSSPHKHSQSRRRRPTKPRRNSKKKPARRFSRPSTPELGYWPLDGDIRDQFYDTRDWYENVYPDPTAPPARSRKKKKNRPPLLRSHSMGATRPSSSARRHPDHVTFADMPDDFHFGPPPHSHAIPHPFPPDDLEPDDAYFIGVRSAPTSPLMRPHRFDNVDDLLPVAPPSILRRASSMHMPAMPPADIPGPSQNINPPPPILRRHSTIGVAEDVMGSENMAMGDWFPQQQHPSGLPGPPGSNGMMSGSFIPIGTGPIPNGHHHLPSEHLDGSTVTMPPPALVNRHAQQIDPTLQSPPSNADNAASSAIQASAATSMGITSDINPMPTMVPPQMPTMPNANMMNNSILPPIPMMNTMPTHSGMMGMGMPPAFHPQPPPFGNPAFGMPLGPQSMPHGMGPHLPFMNGGHNYMMPPFDPRMMPDGGGMHPPFGFGMPPGGMDPMMMNDMGMMPPMMGMDGDNMPLEKSSKKAKKGDKAKDKKVTIHDPASETLPMVTGSDMNHGLPPLSSGPVAAAAAAMAASVAAAPPEPGPVVALEPPPLPDAPPLEQAAAVAERAMTPVDAVVAEHARALKKKSSLWNLFGLGGLKGQVPFRDALPHWDSMILPPMHHHHGHEALNHPYFREFNRDIVKYHHHNWGELPNKGLEEKINQIRRLPYVFCFIATTNPGVRTYFAFRYHNQLKLNRALRTNRNRVIAIDNEPNIRGRAYVNAITGYAFSYESMFATTKRHLRVERITQDQFQSVQVPISMDLFYRYVQPQARRQSQSYMRHFNDLFVKDINRGREDPFHYLPPQHR